MEVNDMKKYTNPKIEISMIETGDIMNFSGENTILTMETNGVGGVLDFVNDFGFTF